MDVDKITGQNIAYPETLCAIAPFGRSRAQGAAVPAVAVAAPSGRDNAQLRYIRNFAPPRCPSGLRKTTHIPRPLKQNFGQ